MKNQWYGVLIALFLIKWAAGQGNLVMNNGFENWNGEMPVSWEKKTSDFTLTKETTETYEGASSVRILLTSKDTQILGQDSIPIVGGNTYRLSMRVMDNDPAGRVRFWGYWYGFEVAGGPQPSYYSADDNNWQLYEYEMEVPLGATSLNLEIRFYDVSSSWDGDAEFIIDDISLVPLTSVKPAIFNITDSVFRAGEAIVVKAMIMDDQGIDNVELNYLVNGAVSPETVPMTEDGGHVWSSVIPELNDQDGLRYWVTASDLDAAQNRSVSDTLNVLVGKTAIGTARGVNGQGIMTYDGYKVRMYGVVTAPAGLFSADRHDEYIQDHSGGINIYSPEKRLDEFVVSDSLEIEGRLVQIGGRAVIEPEYITVLAQNVPQPDPVTVTCAEIGEELEGILVEIRDILISDWAEVADTSFTARVSDGTGELPLLISRETDIDGHVNPAVEGAISITGIISQNDSEIPYDGGYFLRPRQWSDFSITALPDEDVCLPSFRLGQNYPNPFNPATVIQYSVGAYSSRPFAGGAGTAGGTSVQVELSVYTVTGQKVKTLVSGRQPAGDYKVLWDAANYPSGVYIYRLNAGGEVHSRKMLLVR